MRRSPETKVYRQSELTQGSRAACPFQLRRHRLMKDVSAFIRKTGSQAYSSSERLCMPVLIPIRECGFGGPGKEPAKASLCLPFLHCQFPLLGRVCRPIWRGLGLPSPCRIRAGSQAWNNDEKRIKPESLTSSSVEEGLAWSPTGMAVRCWEEEDRR